MSNFDQNPEHQVVVQALRDAGYAERQPVVPPAVTSWEHINLMGDYNCLPANQWVRPHREIAA